MTVRAPKLDERLSPSILAQIDRFHLAVIQDLIVSKADDDRFTYDHSIGVAGFSAALAAEIGLDPLTIGLAAAAGLLHDVGKVMVLRETLFKNGRLTAEEFEHIKAHPLHGNAILEACPIDDRVRRAALMHHERIDGTGYPFGAFGEEIPLLARLVSVADIVDALSADRPYRSGLPEAAVRQELLKLRGGALDPRLVDCALWLMDGRYHDSRWSAYAKPQTQPSPHMGYGRHGLSFVAAGE